MSSLTPRGDGVDGDDGESGFDFGGEFGSAALALMLVSSSSLSLSSSLSVFAMDLANQDIALDQSGAVDRHEFFTWIETSKYDAVS